MRVTLLPKGPGATYIFETSQVNHVFLPVVRRKGSGVPNMDSDVVESLICEIEVNSHGHFGRIFYEEFEGSPRKAYELLNTKLAALVNILQLNFPRVVIDMGEVVTLWERIKSAELKYKLDDLK